MRRTEKKKNNFLCKLDTKKNNLFSLGSMVQKGKFSAGADAFVKTLKKVDLL